MIHKFHCDLIKYRKMRPSNRFDYCLWEISKEINQKSTLKLSCFNYNNLFDQVVLKRLSFIVHLYYHDNTLWYLPKTINCGANIFIPLNIKQGIIQKVKRGLCLWNIKQIVNSRLKHCCDILSGNWQFVNSPSYHC